MEYISEPHRTVSGRAVTVQLISVPRNHYDMFTICYFALIGWSLIFSLSSCFVFAQENCLSFLYVSDIEHRRIISVPFFWMNVIRWKDEDEITRRTYNIAALLDALMCLIYFPVKVTASRWWQKEKKAEKTVEVIGSKIVLHRFIEISGWRSTIVSLWMYILT